MLISYFIHKIFYASDNFTLSSDAFSYSLKVTAENSFAINIFVLWRNPFDCHAFI